MISVEKLIAAVITPAVARTFCPHLDIAMERFQINTPIRVAMFIGQCAHESLGFTHLEENLYYTTADRLIRTFSRIKNLEEAMSLIRKPHDLANRVYSGRGGNGDEASGDGWKYRGRGLIQITFLGMYAKASKGIGIDYIEEPDLVSRPADACLTAAWYFKEFGCNELADNSDIEGITKKINPAMLACRSSLEDF